MPIFGPFSVHSVRLRATRTQIRTVLPFSAERHVLFDFVVEVTHVAPRMTHPIFVEAFGALRIVPQVRIPKTPERMVPIFVGSAVWFHVFPSLHPQIQLAPNLVV